MLFGSLVVDMLKVDINAELQFAKAEVNLSFGLKPDFRSGLSFGLKLLFKTKVLAEKGVIQCSVR